MRDAEAEGAGILVSDSIDPQSVAPTAANQIGQHESKGTQLNQKLRPYLPQAAVLAGAFTVGVLAWKALPLLQVSVSWLGEVLSSKATEGLAAVVVAAFTGMVWWSTDQMKLATAGTLGHLKTEFEAEHRPWLSVKVEPNDRVIPLQFTKDGKCLIYLKLGYENTGRVPAIDVRPRWKLVPPGGDPIAVLREVEAQSVDVGGTSVFPGNPATAPVACTIWANEWTDWYRANPDLRATKEPHVVGMVSYRSPLSKATYVTGFIREVHQKNNFYPIEPSPGFMCEILTSGSILGTGPIT